MTEAAHSLGTFVLGVAFILMGVGLMWVRYAHERHNLLAEAIYDWYEKTQLADGSRESVRPWLVFST